MRPPEPVVLEGRHVRLEPIEARHRDDLVAAATEDPDALRYMLTSIPRDGWDRWFAETQAAVASGAFIAWATVDRARGVAVGSTRFGDIEPAHDRLEIGWTWLAPSAQRTAVNSEAKLLQLGYAFDELGAHRVTLKTDGRNVRSQAAIERLGAVREGVLRHHVVMYDGHRRDTVFYSILADEWPAVRQRLEERLARSSAQGS